MQTDAVCSAKQTACLLLNVQNMEQSSLLRIINVYSYNKYL